ncbi:NAD(P)-binding protein [Wolfiporia cocos MD-104 SS10]|uniref:NAD(P)-binding protein n=1 Tax=Wolfiporia cocos (strain MD-104) TaxID=742152 RepID=A0A2H3J4Z7_WOLCO|nr:NAD(P)-binding protein [Wolfiporia cocos MD-104 SS10]
MGSFFSGLWNIWAVIAQLFPAKSLCDTKSKFSTNQIPDLSGQVMIVTVYMASRSKDKAEAAIQELKEQTGKEAIFLELDLSNLTSVRKAAEEFLRHVKHTLSICPQSQLLNDWCYSKESALHVLFNNAGMMWCPLDLLSADGYDLQFATNVIGHYYFTKLLLPALLSGKETAPDHHTHIIHTSSSGAYLYTINWESFRDGPARRKMSTEQLYYQTKFVNVLIAYQFAKQYADQGIVSISLNPAGIDTELQYGPPGPKSVTYPPSNGALTQLYTGTMPKALNYNGQFLIPWARLGKCRREAYDDVLSEQLWSWLKEQVKDIGVSAES